MMRTYVAICSLCMLTGAGLGYFNGKYSAAAHFVDDCNAVSIVVFHDRQSQTNRHFHCFEIDTAEAVRVPVRRTPPPIPVI